MDATASPNATGESWKRWVLGVELLGVVEQDSDGAGRVPPDGQQHGAVRSRLGSEPEGFDELLAALAKQAAGLAAECLPVGSLRNVAGDVVRGEEAAVGKPGDTGRVVGLAEAGEPFGRGEEVGLGEH